MIEENNPQEGEEKTTTSSSATPSSSTTSLPAPTTSSSSQGAYAEFAQKYMSTPFVTGAIAGVLNFGNNLTGRGETITEIEDDFLWIGNMWAAMQLETLQGLGITHVLGCTSYGDSIRFYPDQFKYLILTLDDIPESDLSVYFEQSVRFITSCKEENGKILVHCAQGRSRSATLILAYLMYTRKITYREALKYIQDRRPQCNPNNGFQVQLYKYEDSLFNKERVLPGPGEIISFENESAKADEPADPSQLRVLTWNVEKGYSHRIPKFTDILSKVNPDIIFLQEVDYYVKRTGDTDVCKEIATSLGMHYVFVVDYEEEYSIRRQPHLQGGGVQGIAILSKYKISNPTAKLYSYQSRSVNPEQPRKGGKAYLTAVVHTPVGKVLACSTRLDHNLPMLGRVRQFGELIDHIDNIRKDNNMPLVIGGDFNTLLTGVAKFLFGAGSDYAPTLGTCEAEWWERHLFTAPQKKIQKDERDEEAKEEKESEKPEEQKDEPTETKQEQAQPVRTQEQPQQSKSWLSGFVNLFSPSPVRSNASEPEILPYTISEEGNLIFTPTFRNNTTSKPITTTAVKADTTNTTNNDSTTATSATSTTSTTSAQTPATSATSTTSSATSTISTTSNPTNDNVNSSPNQNNGNTTTKNNTFTISKTVFSLKDPFSKTADPTYKVVSGAYTAKLDWVLYDHDWFTVAKRGKGNIDTLQSSYVDEGLSDHVFLSVVLNYKEPEPQ